MGNPRNTTWFLHCNDGEATNESVAEALRGLQSDFGEHECSDGKKRFLCPVPNYAFAAEVKKSKGDKVNIFRSKSGKKPEAVNLELLGRWKTTPENTKKASDAIKAAGTPGIVSRTINKLK
jgi:hypothetical protein